MLYVVLLCSFLVVAPVSSERCGLPPSLWCSSREVSRRCDVEKQCEPFLSVVKKVGELVNFTLYMESLCPDSKDFVLRQLYPTFKTVGNIMNLSIVPYGNVDERQVNGNQWKFTCQHGPEECYGNLIETCAIHYHPNSTVYFPFIYCIESNSSTLRKSAPGCAEKFGFDYSQIKNCVEGPLGNSLQHEMAMRTDALKPPHTFVPWVTLNGVHTKKIQSDAELDLQGLICETYRGSPKPEACQKANKQRHH